MCAFANPPDTGKVKLLVGELSSNRVNRIASSGIKGVASLGWISFFSLICAGCSGLPVLAGLFGGVAVATRFGVSVGVASFVTVTVLALRRRRAARKQACALPVAGAAVEMTRRGRFGS